MDMRKWFLESERPPAAEILPKIWHVPSNRFRSENAMQLFVSGLHTNFMLTTADGTPTDSLRLLVRLIYGELVRYEQLPQDELKKIDGIPGTWYIRNITNRLIDLQHRIPWGYDYHHYLKGIFPGLNLIRIKRRKRYVAWCPPNWDIDDAVYEGLHRWSGGYQHRGVDSYAILERLLREKTEVAGVAAGRAAP